MHDDLGVGMANDVVVVAAEQMVAEVLDVGQLAVEGEGEPLPAASVVTLEGLGVRGVVLPAGGIASVADGGLAGVLFENGQGFGRMRQAEDVRDDADVLVGIDNLAPLGVIAGYAAAQLSPVLQVQQQRGDKPGDVSPGQHAVCRL